MTFIVECGSCGCEYDADEGTSCPGCDSGSVIYDPAEVPVRD